MQGNVKGQRVLRRLSKWAFIACGIWLMVLGGYFIFARPSLLPEDLRYLGWSAVQVEAQSPHFASWLQNVFTVMGGFIAGFGVLIIFVSVSAVPQYLPGTGAVLGCAGLLTVATMSWTNFVLDSDFKWLLVIPAIVWLLGLVSFVAGGRAARSIIALPRTDADVRVE